MKKVCVLVVVTLLAILIPVQSVRAAHAMEAAVTEAGQDSSVTIRAQLGVLNGEARELVYGGDAEPGNEGYKVSELIWDMKSVVVAGAVLSIGNSGPLGLNLGLWAGVTEGADGEMYDYDWMDASRTDWTDRSRSEVDLITALMMDANLSFKFIDSGDSSVSAVAGLMVNAWEWDDRGQEYTYSVNGFRDTVGSFEGINVIDYKQTFVIPYIGLEGAADLGGISIQGYVLYSALVVAEDEDYHILRGLHFKETFTGGEYLAYGVSATIDLGENLFVQGSIEHEKVDEIIGDMEVTETGTTNSNGAGISNEATMISAAIGIRL